MYWEKGCQEFGSSEHKEEERRTGQVKSGWRLIEYWLPLLRREDLRLRGRVEEGEEEGGEQGYKENPKTF